MSSWSFPIIAVFVFVSVLLAGVTVVSEAGEPVGTLASDTRGDIATAAVSLAMLSNEILEIDLFNLSIVSAKFEMDDANLSTSLNPANAPLIDCIAAAVFDKSFPRSANRRNFFTGSPPANFPTNAPIPDMADPAPNAARAAETA